MTDDGTTIVVVDDEPNIVDLYADQLTPVGDVRKAYGGEEALEAIDETVDLVLLDRRMPDRSGDEVLDDIAESPYDPLVVLVTAVQPDYDVVDLRFDDYLVKPVKGDELRELVTRVLERGSSRETTREYVALAAKRATLESHKHPKELQASDDFERLERQLESLAERDDADIDRDSVERLLEDLQSG